MNKLILTDKDLKKLVSNICRELAVENWKPDYIVGISRGGCVPAVMLSHYLDIPMHPLKVSLRDGGECVSDCVMAEDAFQGKKILIVDDINDTGATFNWIMNDWPRSCLPNDPNWTSTWNNNVRFAVLVDNLSSECLVKMDYSGIEINKSENDVWVEFPYESWWNQ